MSLFFNNLQYHGTVIYLAIYESNEVQWNEENREQDEEFVSANQRGW